MRINRNLRHRNRPPTGPVDLDSQDRPDPDTSIHNKCHRPISGHPTVLYFATNLHVFRAVHETCRHLLQNPRNVRGSVLHHL